MPARNYRRTVVSMQRRGKHTSTTIEELLGNGVFCSIRLYNEGPRPAELELSKSLETAVEDDWEEMARKELAVQRRLHVWFEVTVRLL
jgi:hypothetical protein